MPNYDALEHTRKTHNVSTPAKPTIPQFISGEQGDTHYIDLSCCEGRRLIIDVCGRASRGPTCSCSFPLVSNCHSALYFLIMFHLDVSLTR